MPSPPQQDELPPKLSIHKAIELAEKHIGKELQEDKAPRYLASTVYTLKADEPSYWEVTWKRIPPAGAIIKGGEIFVRVFSDESIKVLGGQ